MTISFTNVAVLWLALAGPTIAGVSFSVAEPDASTGFPGDTSDPLHRAAPPGANFDQIICVTGGSSGALVTVTVKYIDENGNSQSYQEVVEHGDSIHISQTNCTSVRVSITDTTGNPVDGESASGVTVDSNSSCP